MKTLTLAVLAALTPLAALAQDGMHVEEAYARSTNPKTGAIFMRLENRQQVPCTLQSVASDVAERVELHGHQESGGVMRMSKVDGIPIPAGEARSLARGGDHVMLLGLTRPLANGDSIALTLDFGDCGTKDTTAVVDNQRMDPPADALPAEEKGHGGH
jgi:periplasmic copper chaperone A